MTLRARRRLIGLGVAAAVLAPSAARGQADVLPAGQGSVSVLYHHAYVEDHVFSRGERLDVGHIRAQLLTLDVEYGVTDRLSLRALLPFVATKYTGSQPHAHPGTPPPDFHRLDDGTTHAAFQDVRLETRYVMREFPVALAPFVAIGVPTHAYEVFAHSATGLGMAEVQLGSYAGVLRGRLSAQGKLGFGIYERVIGRRRTRTLADLEVGWQTGRGVRLSVFTSTQVSHGGVRLLSEQVLDRTISRNDWWPHHDQLANANFVNIGGGASFQLSDRIALHGALSRTVSGRNTHAAKYALTAGTTWGFGKVRSPHSASNGR